MTEASWGESMFASALPDFKFKQEVAAVLTQSFKDMSRSIAVAFGMYRMATKKPPTPVFAWTDCPLLEGQPQAIRYVEVVTWDRGTWCDVRWQGGIYRVKRWYLYTKLGRWKADGWYDGRGRWRRNPPRLLLRVLNTLPMFDIGSWGKGRE